jgi:nucleoside phosphorylase
MVGFVFTSHDEAAPFLAQYGRGRLDGISEGEAAFDDDVLVTIVGIGKIKATLRTERLLREHDLSALIHLGCCRTLQDEPSVGQIIAAEQVFEGDRVELSTPSYPRMPIDTRFTKLPAFRIVTQDHTVSGATELTYWQRLAHVSDTTSYPLAYVAATHGVPCDIVKVVLEKVGDQKPPSREHAVRMYESLAAFAIEALPGILAD